MIQFINILNSKLHMNINFRHFVEKKIQLSIPCLPWFLTQYTLPMPLLFACRALDCFLLDGVKVYLFDLFIFIFEFVSFPFPFSFYFNWQWQF